MSGLAEILLKEGFTISGSDIHSSAITERLESKGAKIYFQQTADNITSDIDLVVYTAAINFETNEEYKEAIALTKEKGYSIRNIAKLQSIGIPPFTDQKSVYKAISMKYRWAGKFRD